MIAEHNELPTADEQSKLAALLTGLRATGNAMKPLKQAAPTRNTSEQSEVRMSQDCQEDATETVDEHAASSDVQVSHSQLGRAPTWKSVACCNRIQKSRLLSIELLGDRSKTNQLPLLLVGRTWSQSTLR